MFTILYRLSPFHPLASYPGPFAARISKFWAAYNTFTRGDMHRTLRALHEKYGEVVRVGKLALISPWSEVTKVVQW